MAEQQPVPQGGTGTHSAGYLDGASAEAAFQGLVDRGLLSDQVPAKAAAQVAVPSPPPSVPESQSPEPSSAAAAAPGAPQSEPAGEDYATLDEYLSQSAIDRASFLELPVTVKVDGKDGQVALKDLLRSYQTDAHVTQRSQAQAAKEQAWVAEQAQAKQVLTQNLTTAQQLVQYAHQQIMHEFQNIQWEQLKASDPNQFLIKRGELQERFAAIQQNLQQVQALQQQQNAEAQQRMTQQLDAERERMLEAFPEWRDPQKFQTATAELKGYAKTIGFNEAELAAIADHRYMKVLHDASRFAALQAKSPAVLKMVRAAPPMASPGARTQRDPNAARFQQARTQMRANPRNEDAQVAAFSALVDRGL